MRRLTILIFLLTAPAAHAAPLVEQPHLALPRSAPATCLRVTGGASEVAMYGREGSTERLTLAHGIAGTARVRLGHLVSCAATATAGNASVVAGAVGRRPRAWARASVNGAAPVTLGSADPTFAAVAAAIAPDGRAVVAWVQPQRDKRRIVAARRAPGRGFGAVEPLSDWRRGIGDSQVAAAVAADGTSTVAWVQPIPGGTFLGRAQVAAARAVAGGPFVRQRIADRVRGVTRLALATAPDGWALLAYDEINALHVLERAPAAARFTDVFRREGWAPDVAIRSGGGAVVAWRTSQEGSTAGVGAATRSTGGRFTAQHDIVPDDAGVGFGVGFLVISTGGPPVDYGPTLRTAVAPDGRALVAWTSPRRETDVARVAAGTLSSGFGRPARLGGPVRDVDGVAPLFLADGRPALAWIDNAEPFGRAASGRLHLAIEAAPPQAEPVAPHVTISAPSRQRLFPGQPLRAALHCDRACDLRASLIGKSDDFGLEIRTLPHAGTVHLELDGWKGSRPRIHVRASAPGGRRFVAVSRRVTVVRRPPLPFPRLVDVRAVRRGGTIVVSWRTTLPARRVFFSIIATRKRRPGLDLLDDLGAFGSLSGNGRTRFHLRLRPENARRLHWVRVFAVSFDADRSRAALVRVIDPR